MNQTVCGESDTVEQLKRVILDLGEAGGMSIYHKLRKAAGSSNKASTTRRKSLSDKSNNFGLLGGELIYFAAERGIQNPVRRRIAQRRSSSSPAATRQTTAGEPILIRSCANSARKAICSRPHTNCVSAGLVDHIATNRFCILCEKFVSNLYHHLPQEHRCGKCNFVIPN